MDLLSPEISLIVWTLIALVAILFPLAALFSLLRSTFKDSIAKLIWLLVILFVPVIGPLFYFLVGRKKRLKIA